MTARPRRGLPSSSSGRRGRRSSTACEHSARSHQGEDGDRSLRKSPSPGRTGMGDRPRPPARRRRASAPGAGNAVRGEQLHDERANFLLRRGRGAGLGCSGCPLRVCFWIGRPLSECGPLRRPLKGAPCGRVAARFRFAPPLTARLRGPLHTRRAAGGRGHAARPGSASRRGRVAGLGGWGGGFLVCFGCRPPSLRVWPPSPAPQGRSFVASLRDSASLHP